MNFSSLITLFLMILVVIFIVRCRTPVEVFYLLGEVINSFINEIFGIDLKHRPVVAFIVPLRFFLVFGLLVMGILPYRVSFIISWRVVFFLRFSCWLRAFYHIIRVRRFSSYLMKKGYPLYFRAFIVVIELVSEFMKPFSLGIRLYCNFIFGHYLLLYTWVLLDKLGPWAYIFSTPAILFELGVYLVQSFVFRFLLGLYYSE